MSWSCLIWVAMIATVVATQVALHSPLAWDRNVASSAAALGLSVVPVHAPLGIGTQDGIWSGVLMAAGLPDRQAIPLALSARLLLVGIVLCDGLGGLVLLAATGRRRR